jgi:hypothetical protein
MLLPRRSERHCRVNVNETTRLEVFVDNSESFCSSQTSGLFTLLQLLDQPLVECDRLYAIFLDLFHTHAVSIPNQTSGYSTTSTQRRNSTSVSDSSLLTVQLTTPHLTHPHPSPFSSTIPQLSATI